MERFGSQPISGAKQLIFLSIPQSKPPHAVELCETIFTPFAVGIQLNFRVAGGVEGIPQSFQLGAKFHVVI